jgi:subtilisin-like proprotein convertase family protein
MARKLLIQYARAVGFGILLCVAACCTASGQISETNLFTGVDLSIPSASTDGITDIRTSPSQIAQLTAVRVRLKIDGDFNGDLYAYLSHTSGQTTHLAVLLNRPGRTATNPDGYNDDGFDVVFSDKAAADVHTYWSVVTPAPGSPLTGQWQPDARFVDPDLVTTDSPRLAFLSLFNGMAGAGQWTLFVADVGSGGTNYLESWGLELTGKALPNLTWSPPAALVYGAALTAQELNALADVPGTFVYNPPLGTVLGAGSGQPLTVTFLPADTNQYATATASVTIDVAPQPATVSAWSASKTYGQTLSFAGTEFTVAGLVNGDMVTNVTLVSAGTPATAGTGVYDIVPSAPMGTFNATNYEFSFVSGTLTVNPASLMGTAGDAFRLYGQANPLFTVTYSGFVNGQDASVVTGTLSGSSPADTNSPVGPYPISVGGQSAPNYTIQYVDGTLTVVPTPLEVTADDASRAYGQPNPVFTATFSGWVNGEDTNVLGGALVLSCAAETNSPVGTYPIIPSGLTATNYALQFSNAVLSITQADSVCTVLSSTNMAAPGAPVTFSASLSALPPSVGTPTGSVQFKVDGANYGAPVGLNQGLATLTTASLARGVHTVTVEYAGDQNFQGTTNSLVPPQLIDNNPVAATAAVLRPVSTGTKLALSDLLASGRDASGGSVSLDHLDPMTAAGGTVLLTNGWILYTPPAGFTGPDSFTYTVRDSLGALSTGTVDINPIPDMAAAATLSLTGLAGQAWRLQIGGIPWGTYTLQYRPEPDAGDWMFLGLATMDETGWAELEDTPPAGIPSRFYRAVFQGGEVLSASFSTALRASATTATPGTDLTFTLNVDGWPAGSPTPQGQVQFTLDGTNYGAAVSLLDGQASLSTTDLPWGLHDFAAEYSGDANYAGCEVALDEPLLIDTPPVAGFYNLQTPSGSGIKMPVSDLLAQAYDADGDPLSFDTVNTNSAEGGTVSMAEGWIFYTPPAGALSSDSFTYSICDSLGLTTTGLVNIVSTVGNGPSPNLLVIEQPPGTYEIQVSAVPWRTYTLEYAPSRDSTNWNFLATCTADSQGLIVYDDTLPQGTTDRYYQAVSDSAGPTASPFRLACWTNFIALTNGRVMEMWSERSYPADWPAVPPVLAWNTNCLIYGLDGFTAISQCNDHEGAPGQVPGTLITRRHMMMRGHSMGASGFSITNFAGHQIWFCTASNTVIQMTVAAGFIRLGWYNGEYYDYGLFVFTEDVPDSLTPISVISESDFQTYYYSTPEIPYLLLGTEQFGNVATEGTPIAPFIYPLYEGGDSGSPDFIISPDNKLVMFSGRDISGFSPQLAADLDALTSQVGLDPNLYQLRWYDLSPWAP